MSGGAIPDHPLRLARRRRGRRASKRSSRKRRASAGHLDELGINAAAISRIPLTVTDQSTFYRLPGQSSDDAREQVALTRVVTRDYFPTIGARLSEGRWFDISDKRSDSPAAVVNESFAARNFPGRSPLGGRFQFGRFGEKAYWYTIVGVVTNIRERGVAEELRPAVYRVHEQAIRPGISRAAS